MQAEQEACIDEDSLFKILNKKIQAMMQGHNKVTTIPQSRQMA